MTNTIQKKLKARRLDILFQESYTSLLFPTVLAISMAYAFRDQLAITSMMAWLAIFLLVTGIRLYSAHIFVRSKNSSSNIDYWFSWHIFGVIISGIIWGVFILLLVKTTDFSSLGLAAGCAVSLSAGASFM